MRATILNAPFDIRIEERSDPTIEEPTDAIVRVVASCICGSDLWSYRGINRVSEPRMMGHECVGEVVAVGSSVTGVRVGQFVVAPFSYSCGSCAHCRAGVTTSCVRGGFYLGNQAEFARIPQADGTLVATPEWPDSTLVPALLALSDVMCTGWHAAVSARVRPGMTVAVVGDGAVGLCGVLAARLLGAERIIAMSRHPERQRIASAFGATHLIAERGKEGVDRVRDVTDGVGADAVLECVGTHEAMHQAMSCARPGATVGFVGVPHGVELPIGEMFGRNVGLSGGVASVRTYLPDLMARVLKGDLDPSAVFDQTLPLDGVAVGYRAMDERAAIKVLLRP